MQNSPSRYRRLRNPNVASMVMLAVMLIVAAVLVPLTTALARGTGLPKDTIITGPVSECGGFASGGIRRTMVISLHSRPTGRVLATYVVRPNDHWIYYAFAVTNGTYFLTTNQPLSKPTQGNIVVSRKSHSTVEVAISTVCQ